jgi:hypothetical protein
VTVPTLVLDSEGSSDDLTGMAAMVVGALPKGLDASTRAAPARCWTDSANASVVTSTSLTALSSSSRLATKNTRPPTTHDADRRIQSSLAGGPEAQSSLAGGPAEARGTTMTGSRERRTRRAETPPSSTRRIGP